MIFTDTLRKQSKSNEIPFWFMRQAGRYLPEYKKVRANFSQFLEFCYTPEAACEVTIQPITRFGMSAAIIFSDILVIPDALGANVWFEEKKGPQLTPITTIEQMQPLALSRMPEKLSKVYEAISLTRASLPKDKALIGFCGSPWTLACYMVEGKGSRDFASVRSLAFRDSAFFSSLIQLLSDAIISHSSEQIKAGANAIQLFDSWSGVLSEAEFDQWVINPTKRIVASLKALHPDIPIIGFPRMCGEKVKKYVGETGVDVVSFDGSITLDFAKNQLQEQIIVQGNLDSILLAEDKNAMLIQAKKIIENLGRKSFIFNLAHGIVPHTPVENVQALCDLIKESKCG